MGKYPQEITVALNALKEAKYEVEVSPPHSITGCWVFYINTGKKKFILIWKSDERYGISHIKDEVSYTSIGAVSSQELSTKNITEILAFIQKRIE